MTTIDCGLFRLVNPPGDDDRATADEYAMIVMDAYTKIDFPWWRIIPGLRSRGLENITVRWGLNADMPAGSIGFYDGSTATIWISYQYGPSGTGFTFAHECGHAVDALSFSWETQQDLMAFWHGLQCYHHNKTNSDGSPYIWSHEYPHPEKWTAFGNVNYAHRHNEAYADAFVAAFAPGMWGSKGTSTRFSHWPVNFAKSPPAPLYGDVRALTLKENIVAFTDVPDSHPHYEGIMWASGEGIISGYPDGTFKPDVKVKDQNGVVRTDIKIEGIVSRGQFATMLKRAHENPSF